MPALRRGAASRTELQERKDCMRTIRNIRLTPEQAPEFVRAAAGCNFDIDIAGSHRTRCTVDAKSILGVMGLDFKDTLVVSYNGHSDSFEKRLREFAAAY